jgi:hypothetical protein
MRLQKRTSKRGSAGLGFRFAWHGLKMDLTSVENKKKFKFESGNSNLNFQTMSVYCILFGCGGGV